MISTGLFVISVLSLLYFLLTSPVPDKGGLMILEAPLERLEKTKIRNGTFYRFYFPENVEIFHAEVPLMPGIPNAIKSLKTGDNLRLLLDNSAPGRHRIWQLEVDNEVLLSFATLSDLEIKQVERDSNVFKVMALIFGLTSVALWFVFARKSE